NAHPQVCLATAQALVVLEARTTAPTLMRHAQDGSFDLAQMLEPALAQWDYAPMRPVWLARLADSKTPRGQLRLAVRAAASIKAWDAVPHLRRLTLDSRVPGDVRLEAARALAVLQSTGLETDARLLATDVAPAKTV